MKSLISFQIVYICLQSSTSSAPSDPYNYEESPPSPPVKQENGNTKMNSPTANSKKPKKSPPEAIELSENGSENREETDNDGVPSKRKARKSEVTDLGEPAPKKKGGRGKAAAKKNIDSPSKVTSPTPSSRKSFPLVNGVLPIVDDKQIIRDRADDGSFRYGFVSLHPYSLIILRHLRTWEPKNAIFFCDNDASSSAQAKQFGAIECESVTSVVDHSDIIFTSFLTVNDAHTGFFHPENGIAMIANPSKYIVDIGTPDLTFVDRVNVVLSDRRIAYAYCAIFGSVVDAVDCKLSFCVAGAPHLRREISNILRRLGGEYQTPGQWRDPCQALKVKSIVDMVTATQNLAVCQGLGLANTLNLPTDYILDIIKDQSKNVPSCVLHAKSAKKNVATPKDRYNLPLSLSEAAGGGTGETYRNLTCPVSYAAAFASCFNSISHRSLVEGGSIPPSTLHVTMTQLLAANSEVEGGDRSDMASLFQRTSGLI